MKIRWPMLLCGIIFLFLAYWQKELTLAIVSFLVGMTVGFSLDLVGVKKLGLWNYPRQSFMGKHYFGIVVPAWGIFGMSLNLILNWFVMSWTVIAIIFLVLYELSNLRTRSWQYHTPHWLVVIGWFPLVLVFRTAFIFALNLPVIINFP